MRLYALFLLSWQWSTTCRCNAESGEASTLRYTVPVANNPGHPIFYPDVGDGTAVNATVFSSTWSSSPSPTSSTRCEACLGGMLHEPRSDVMKDAGTDILPPGDLKCWTHVNQSDVCTLKSKHLLALLLSAGQYQGSSSIAQWPGRRCFRPGLCSKTLRLQVCPGVITSCVSMIPNFAPSSKRCHSYVLYISLFQVIISDNEETEPIYPCVSRCRLC